MNRRQAPGGWRGGDDGFAIVLVALFLVVFLVVTAIVVDLGNARQQRREAVTAADAGALAGAESITNGSPPLGCNPGDPNCVAAYYTFKSANVVPAVTTRGTCTLAGETSVVGTEQCYQYAAGNITVDVKYPYSLDGSTADMNVVQVKVCWDAATSFARVIGMNSVNVCGNAAAKNTPDSPGTTTTIAPDCAGEDNFLDQPSDAGNATNFIMKEGDFPSPGGALNLGKAITTITPSVPTVIGAVFHGFDSDIDVANTTFSAPTKTSGLQGVSVSLTSPDKVKGPKDANVKAVTFSIMSLDAGGKLQPYNPNKYPTHNFVVAYDLPKYTTDNKTQLLLTDANGNKIIYHAAIRALDLDQDHAPAVDCGNAAYDFTADGSSLSGSSCIENSFLAAGVFPSNGVATPGTEVGAYYTDESPLQSQDTILDSTPYGVDFEFTDATGATHHIAPQGRTSDAWGGYTLTPLLKTDPVLNGHGDAYNTKISWTLPSDPKVLSSGKFSVFLKAYDTDQNKGGTIGHDCGQSTWSFQVSGYTGPGTPGNVRLVQ